MLQTFKGMSDHLKTMGFVYSPNTVRNWQYLYGYAPKRAGRMRYDSVEDFELFFNTKILRA